LIIIKYLSANLLKNYRETCHSREGGNLNVDSRLRGNDNLCSIFLVRNRTFIYYYFLDK